MLLIDLYQLVFSPIIAKIHMIIMDYHICIIIILLYITIAL